MKERTGWDAEATGLIKLAVSTIALRATAAPAGVTLWFSTLRLIPTVGVLLGEQVRMSSMDLSSTLVLRY